jgi:hypothetical protein
MFCGTCGTQRVEGEAFCRTCGAAFDAADPPPAAQGDPAADAPVAGELKLGAGLLTFFMPLIALIVALAIRAGERRPRRREFLKTWAVLSGAWLCTGWIVGLLAFGLLSGSTGGGGCQGGVDPFGVPSYTSTDNKHWTVVEPCVNGGSRSRAATPSENRQLNSP